LLDHLVKFTAWVKTTVNLEAVSDRQYHQGLQFEHKVLDRLTTLNQQKMNYAEEQAMEMEALAAIFGDQFEQKSPSSCVIHATPNADQVHLACYLDFDLPATYPEVLPNLTVRSDKGMNDAWNQELKDKLLESGSDLLGAAMIFTMVESAREWITERNVAGVGEGSMYAQMIAKEHEKQRVAELERQQQAKKDEKSSGGGKGGSGQGKKQEVGTPVTAENFNKWMQGLIKEEARTIAESASKLTGRQLFEKGTIKAQDEEVVAGDVEDFDRNLILEEDVDLDMLDDDDDEDDEDYVEGVEEEDEDDETDEEEEAPSSKAASNKPGGKKKQ